MAKCQRPGALVRWMPHIVFKRAWRPTKPTTLAMSVPTLRPLAKAMSSRQDRITNANELLTLKFFDFCYILF